MMRCDEDEDGEDSEDGDHVDVKAGPTTKVVMAMELMITVVGQLDLLSYLYKFGSSIKSRSLIN